jgi:chromosome partitioning protein
MMKIIAVVQNKGGVGKTTLSKILSENFARLGIATLGLDLDPQCNYSRRFLSMDMDPADPDGVAPPMHPDYNREDDVDWSGRSSTADIYYSGQVVPYATRFELLNVIPGEGEKLRDVELIQKQDLKEYVHNRLRKFLSLPDVRELYQIVVIDTSPSKGPLTVSAIHAATHLIIPTVLEPQPIEGLYGMLQLWRRENRRRDTAEPLEIICIQPNLFRKGVALHEGLFESLMSDDGIAPLLSPVVLHQRIAFAESDHPAAEPRSVFDLPEKDPARLEAERLCEFVRERLFGSEID